MYASFKNMLPVSENKSGQTVKQKEMVQSNLIGMRIVMMNIVATFLFVTIEKKTKREEWLSDQFYEVIEILDKEFLPKYMMSRAVQK